MCRRRALGKKNSLNTELAEGGGPPAAWILPRFHGDGDALGGRGNTVHRRGGRGMGWVFLTPASSWRFRTKNGEVEVPSPPTPPSALRMP